jgi:SAM-dependent methyltransferase
MKVDHTALAVLRDYLDTMAYPLVDRRVALGLGANLTGFPKFDSLRGVVDRLGRTHQVLFRLFRLGMAVDDEAVRAALPDRVLAALVSTELVVRAENGGWRTPDLLLVPAEGLLLITGTPPSYPTAEGPSPAWFDLSTSMVAGALPGSLAGARVLDVCSGTGVQALLCATRGAAEAVGLELVESAVVVATANAVLNGLADRVRFRRSDVLSGLADGERFDFVVGNLPYVPVLRERDRPGCLAEIGTSVLWPLLDALPAHLAERARGFVAIWRAIGHDGSTYQLASIADRLAAEGCAVSAYVDPTFDTVDGVLGVLTQDLVGRAGVAPVRAQERVEGVRRLIDTAEQPIDGFYNQFVHFSRTPGRRPERQPSVHGPGRVRPTRDRGDRRRLAGRADIPPARQDLTPPDLTRHSSARRG